jgi:nucleotide-binding universal stress UspA family protein
MIDRPVICGIDGSSSAGAVAVAHDLADRFGLPLHYVHVVDASAPSTQIKLVRTAHVELEYGHPADRLVAIALEREAAFLVVGCHGERWSMLGSISADVSRRAPCPVVVVPPGAGGVAAVEHEATVSA